MIINDSKGSFGCFSFAGRTSAELYKVCIDNNQVNISKKPQEQKKKNEESQIDQEIDDLFNIDANKINKESIKELPINNSPTVIDYYKFYNKHKSKKKKTEKTAPPSCTYYNPKQSFIMKRMLSGPKWKSQTPKKFFIKTDNTHYYLNHEDITSNKAGRTLIDMSKMTMRGEFTNNSKDVRIKNIKALTKSNSSNYFSPNKTGIDSSKKMTISSVKDNSIQLRKSTSLSINNYNTLPIKISPLPNQRPSTASIHLYNAKKLFQRSSQKELSLTTSSNDSYETYKHIYQKQFKHSSSSSGKKKRKKAFVKGIDFRRTITRKHLDKLSDKKSLLPFSLPNYKQVRERPVMMVSYEYNNHKIKRQRTLSTIDSSPYLNPYKHIDKINNHKKISTPNFKLMKLRPSSDHPLPLFMNKIYNRLAGYETTDLSLKLNNYIEGCFQEQASTFFPKKTFNKIINLNLLNSNQFLTDLNCKQISDGSKTSKAMRFYNKNYEDLMKEALLTKFDGVTLKSNSKQNKLDLKEIESFLLNYEIKIRNSDDDEI